MNQPAQTEVCLYCGRVIAGPMQICAMIAHKYCEVAGASVPVPQTQPLKPNCCPYHADGGNFRLACVGRPIYETATAYEDDRRSMGNCLKHGDYDGRNIRRPKCAVETVPVVEPTPNVHVVDLPDIRRRKKEFAEKYNIDCPQMLQLEWLINAEQMLLADEASGVVQHAPSELDLAFQEAALAREMWQTISQWINESPWRDKDIEAYIASVLRKRREPAALDPKPHAIEAPPEELVIEIARELYDRFVMGGWEPQDAYPQIRAWLAGLGQ